MKQLVVLCHPSNKNLGELIWAELSAIYEKYKLDFEVRDLYKIGFNPIIGIDDIIAAKDGTALDDVLKEREYIAGADCITFIYSSLRTGVPALLKGYIDRVFSEGFAYSFTEKGVKKLLEGKKIVIVNVYDRFFGLPHKRTDCCDHAMACEKQLFGFCGMEVILHYYLEDIIPENDSSELKVRIKDLIIEIKKSLILTKNCHLTIPTTFF